MSKFTIRDINDSSTENLRHELTRGHVDEVNRLITAELERRNTAKETADRIYKQDMKCLTKRTLGFTLVAAIAGVIAVGIALFALCK